MNNRANWQLPVGVSPGTWDYAQAEQIAADYDDYFQRYGMFRLDDHVIARHFQPGRRVIDLGCGTGRAVLPLVQRGFQAVAFDLSQAMLREVNRKRSDASQPGSLFCVRGNLVDLSCFADHSFDYAICLFSTLGMVAGHKHRQDMVRHVARILKPNGLFVLQVHNYWAHLFDPEGPWWMLRNLVRSKWNRDEEIGDKLFPYRGIPNMYLHSFRKRELLQLLADHDLAVVEWMPLNRRQTRPLRLAHVADALRASGWIVVASKKTD